jgi:hypothetical protein
MSPTCNLMNLKACSRAKTIFAEDVSLCSFKAIFFCSMLLTLMLCVVNIIPDTPSAAVQGWGDNAATQI